MGFREFSEAAKEAFVDVTSADYGIRGRPTNISRVAVLTGLTRKEVSRLRQKLRELADQNQLGVGSKGRPELILERWFHDPAYLGSDGRPLVMPAEGQEPSFTTLVRAVGGDIPPGAMAKELIRAGSVVETEDGGLAAVRETFVPEAADPQAVDYAGDAIRDLVKTINNNLYGEGPSGKLLERRLLIHFQKKSDARKFLKTSSAEAERLLNKLNELTGFAGAPSSDGDGKSHRVGIGIYVIRD